MLRANNREEFGMDFDSFVEELNARPGLPAALDAAFAEIVEERAETLPKGGGEDAAGEEKKRAGGG